MSDNISRDQLKKLFLYKAYGIKRKKGFLLKKLYKNYPELFDWRFIYEVMKGESEGKIAGATNQLDAILRLSTYNQKVH